MHQAAVTVYTGNRDDIVAVVGGRIEGIGVIVGSFIPGCGADNDARRPGGVDGVFDDRAVAAAAVRTVNGHNINALVGFQVHKIVEALNGVRSVSVSIDI